MCLNYGAEMIDVRKIIAVKLKYFLQLRRKSDKKKVVDWTGPISLFTIKPGFH